MSKSVAEEEIPVQYTGRCTDFKEEKRFKSESLAHEGFLVTAARLLTVGEWHKYAGRGSSKFCLTNNQGKELSGYAQEGFYFYIDLPAPGPAAGDGLEWVMIERIEALENAEAPEEFVAMVVRPAPDPRRADIQIAHFFSDISTSTFIVKRKGNIVSAEVHGRNESPNNKEVDFHDKVRNTIIALVARIGLSGPQWKKLVKGLLEE